jgi:cobalt-zinc-cadmium efflux system membrane fusion protein
MDGCVVSRRARCAVLCVVLGCGGSLEEPVAEESAEAAEGPRVVELSAELAERAAVSTVEVASVRTSGAIVALGEVGVDEHAYALVDAPAAGRVVALLAHVGDRVEVGTPLAELSSGDVGGLRSELGAARARITAAEARLTRRRTLLGERLASATEVELAETELADARAAEARALSALRAADAARGAAGALVVRAPIAGVVLEHHAFPGEAAMQDDHLFEIADLDHLWLLAHVAESEAAALRAGTNARITFPGRSGGERTLPIALVGDRVEAETRTVEVRIDLDNADRALRVGMAASVLFLPDADAADARALVLVPRAAVQHSSLGWTVFVQAGERRYEARPVLRGRDLGDEVEILRGVRAGDTVVTEGSFLLRSMADAGEWGEG